MIIVNKYDCFRYYLLNSIIKLNLFIHLFDEIGRKSSIEEKYPDNADADWYGIIRNGVLEKIPSVIIEHAYLDNKNDYDNFLSSDEKIKKLAIADMKGIVNFFKLKKQNVQNN